MQTPLVGARRYTAAVLTAIAVLATLFAAPAHAAAPDPNPQATTTSAWTMTSSTSATSDAVTVTARFVAPEPTSGSLLFNVEVWNSAKMRAYRHTSIQTATTGQTITLSFPVPLSSLPSDNYTVRQGVWDADWQPKFAGLTQTSAFSTSSGGAITGPAQSTSAWGMTSSPSDAGDTIEILAKFTAPDPTIGNFVLNVEVWDAYKKAFQKASTQAMTTGNTVMLTISVPKTSPAGNYTVRQGVWEAGWVKKFAGMTHTSSFRIDEVLAAPGDPDAGDPLAGSSFYGVNKNAAAQAEAWKASRPSDAWVMSKVASIPTATWFSGADPDTGVAVQRVVDAGVAQNKVPVLVAYNIPNRDCGNYSAGGAASEADYKAWVQSFASGIGSRKAVVIIEPDALAQLCGDVASRYRSLNDAVDAFSALPNAVVYLDAGVNKWLTVDEAASRLQLAGVAKIRGFSLNVANYKWTSENESYGNAIATKLGNKHFVIDTSRNGKGYNGEWCNALGRGYGKQPTTTTATTAADAYLWIKTPGISDGPCNGGPNAGVWWPEYALGLWRNMGW